VSLNEAVRYLFAERHIGILWIACAVEAVAGMEGGGGEAPGPPGNVGVAPKAMRRHNHLTNSKRERVLVSDLAPGEPRNGRWQGSAALCFLAAALLAAVAASPGQPAGPAGGQRNNAVVWKVPIGSSSGSPVVHRGKVLIGTNCPAGGGRSGVRGAVMCFHQATGALLGQVAHEKLPHRSNDLPGQGHLLPPLGRGRPGLLRQQSRRTGLF